jgi:hypothetical protein
MRRKILSWIIRNVPKEDIPFILEEIVNRMKKRKITKIRISNLQGGNIGTIIRNEKES